ncbi:MAG: DUF4281 domain-containing protein [Pseudomonadales bacterium]|nr:DUF4281 domain-containing protein [Pseudomonadales bacterium]
MNYEAMFSVVGVLSFVGWGALVFSLVSLWGLEPELDYSSLSGVSNGFSNMGHLLTGWIHFLAFDLFIGAWQVERSVKVGIHHIVVLLCLVLTFLFGPLGLVLFLMIQSIKTRSIDLA